MKQEETRHYVITDSNGEIRTATLDKKDLDELRAEAEEEQAAAIERSPIAQGASDIEISTEAIEEAIDYDSNEQYQQIRNTDANRERLRKFLTALEQEAGETVESGVALYLSARGYSNLETTENPDGSETLTAMTAMGRRIAVISDDNEEYKAENGILEE